MSPPATARCTARAPCTRVVAVRVAALCCWWRRCTRWWPVWGAALVADLALTLCDMLHGYAFHRVYDRWRPVARPGQTLS